MTTSGVRMIAVRPERPWYPPGSTASVELAFRLSAAGSVRAVIELLDVERVVERVEHDLGLPSGTSSRSVPIDLPRASRHGYGVRATVTPEDGGRSITRTSAVECLDGWWESPRHAALTEFRSADRTADATSELRDWHVTVAQAYDWMYRHYQYAPPSGEPVFLDALGRQVSHDAVRAGIRTAHEAGIAVLAYGSVYGAEREYVDEHPDERVFGHAGEPLSLGETFYINDVRPGRPWRERLLNEYAQTIRDFGFDGIHMDTYGPPHRAVGHDGEPIEFATLYPGLIEDGARTVAATREGAKVTFNCVEGFPLEQVARAPAAALYLEVWPPDAAYRDVVAWIDRARSLGAGRAVIIAAYISMLRSEEHSEPGRAGAVEAAVLLTSIIAAAGGYHHVIAERDRLLVEGYYPEARPLRAFEREELRAAWVFGARYLHLLSDPASMSDPDVAGALGVFDADGACIPTSLEPCAGALWVRGTRLADGKHVLQLIDLLDQQADTWDAVRQPSPQRRGWRIDWGLGQRGLVAASPWTAGGDADPLDTSADATSALPDFRRWLVVVAR